MLEPLVDTHDTATDPPSDMDDYVEWVLAAAPPLTDEQRARLCELFRPVGEASQ